ncbi:MAG: GspH/FimT family pseudopilin [Janthinobacterium lividum]
MFIRSNFCGHTVIHTRPSQNGFTLIEMIITTTIVAILAGVAIPSFSTLIKDSRLTTSTNDLKVDLALARSEASKRGFRVAVCASNTGTGCTATAWNLGRIVFVDRDGDGVVDGNDEILRVSSALPANNKITASFTNTGYIQFRPSGLSDSTGNFALCDDRAGKFGRTIAINSVGRANLTTKVTCP